MLVSLNYWIASDCPALVEMVDWPTLIHSDRLPTRVWPVRRSDWGIHHGLSWGPPWFSGVSANRIWPIIFQTSCWQLASTVLFFCCWGSGCIWSKIHMQNLLASQPRRSDTVSTWQQLMHFTSSDSQTNSCSPPSLPELNGHLLLWES